MFPNEVMIQTQNEQISVENNVPRTQASKVAGSAKHKVKRYAVVFSFKVW